MDAPLFTAPFIASHTSRLLLAADATVVHIANDGAPLAARDDFAAFKVASKTDDADARHNFCA